MKRRTVGIELIGSSVLVAGSTNPSLVGTEGKIIDETRATIKVMTENGPKTLVKDQVRIRIDGKEIDGKDLVGRIEERIRKS